MTADDEPPPQLRTPEMRIDEAVRGAVDAGLSWKQIGAQLGMSRGEARRKYRRKLGIDRRRK